MRLGNISLINESRLFDYVQPSGQLSDVSCAGTLNVCVISGYLIRIISLFDNVNCLYLPHCEGIPG